jgi:Rap1a immunity proteins
MRLRALLVATGLLWPVSAQEFGYFENGNKLLDECNADLSTPQSGSCIGYVMGVADALTSLRVICTPDHSTVGQMRDIVKNQLRAHPERRHLPAATEARLALQQAFPCR